MPPFTKDKLISLIRTIRLARDLTHVRGVMDFFEIVRTVDGQINLEKSFRKAALLTHPDKYRIDDEKKLACDAFVEVTQYFQRIVDFKQSARSKFDYHFKCSNCKKAFCTYDPQGRTLLHGRIGNYKCKGCHSEYHVRFKLGPSACYTYKCYKNKMGQRHSNDVCNGSCIVDCKTSQAVRVDSYDEEFLRKLELKKRAIDEARDNVDKYTAYAKAQLEKRKRALQKEQCSQACMLEEHVGKKARQS